jgi:hypothetical protein
MFKNRKQELTKMHKENKWDEDEVESEDDLYETNIEVGTQVDFLLNKDAFKWVPGKVICNLGKVVKIQNESDKMEVDGEANAGHAFWINKDSSDLSLYRSKSTSLKAKVNSLYLKAYWNL